MTRPFVPKPDPLGQSADIRMGEITALSPLSIRCNGVTIDNQSVVISDSLPAAVGDSCLVAVFGSGLHWVFSVKGGA